MPNNALSIASGLGGVSGLTLVDATLPTETTATLILKLLISLISITPAVITFLNNRKNTKK